MGNRISVVLIDDNPGARERLVELIRARPGFEVLAVSARVEEAVELVRKTRPDLALLNLRRDGDATMALAGLLRGEVPESRVIVMGLRPAQEDVASLIGAGVSGFVTADASFGTLLGTLHSVHQGIKVLSAELTASLFDQLKGRGAPWRSKQLRDELRLTLRERAVSELIVQGMSYREIAGRLEIALRTVKSHVHRILAKLAVTHLLEVTAFPTPALVLRI